MSEHTAAVLVTLIGVLFAGDGFIRFIINRWFPSKTAQKTFEVVEGHTETMDETKKIVDELKTELNSMKETVNSINDDVADLKKTDQDRIRRLLKEDYKKHKSRGYWTPIQKAYWNENFSIYTRRNGNGEIKVYNDDLQTLPIRDDEGA